jgi:hypothetical protein
MSGFPKLFAIVALSSAALSVPAQARGPGTHVNDAKYYGPVYGWRYSPPPAVASEPVCTLVTARAVRNGHSVTRRVRKCS